MYFLCNALSCTLEVRHLYSEGQFEVMPISHGVRILLVYPNFLDLPTLPRLYLNPPLLNLPCRGGDLGRDWGTSVPPNILRSSVVGCARKYEQSKKWCHKEIPFINSGCSCDERVIYDIEHSKRYGKSGKRKGKSEKPGQRLNKKFLKKRH